MGRKLPVLATLVAALDLCREHRSYALKIMAPWFVILSIAPYLLISLSGGVPKAIDVDDFQPWQLVQILMYVVGWGSIAVLWHWRVLRDDSRSGKTVVVDRRVWFYVLRGLLISIIIGAVALFLMIPLVFILSFFTGASFDSIPFFAMIACLLFIVGLVAARLSVALPAIALDVPNFGLGDAWKATSGNGLRLLVVTALPLVPLYLLSFSLDAFGASELDLYRLSPPFILLHILYQVLDFVFGLIGLTVLSLTYAFFVESRETDRVPET